jgi:hypothetical protein
MILITAVITAIALAAIVIAAVTHYTNDYLRRVIASTYSLAGVLAHQDNPDLVPEEALDDEEFNAGIILLLNVLANPNSLEADELVRAKPHESYIAILERATGIRTIHEGSYFLDPRCYGDPIDTPAPHESTATTVN